MLVNAIIWNTNSLPARFAGSPVQDSSCPRTANSTPTLFKILANALVIFLARSSKLPAQPTQKSTSGDFPSAAYSAIVFICKSIFIIKCMMYYCKINLKISTKYSYFLFEQFKQNLTFVCPI